MPKTLEASNASRANIPIFGILSVAMAPLAVLYAALFALIVETFVEAPPGVSMHEHIPRTTRALVLTSVTLIAIGLISAVIAIVRRETPRWLPFAGLATTALVIGWFDYLAWPD